MEPSDRLRLVSTALTVISGVMLVRSLEGVFEISVGVAIHPEAASAVWAFGFTLFALNGIALDALSSEGDGR